jgi:acetylornithine deacetylase/succinyl-diaminopimelate desuccinylase-like protein
MTLALLRLGRPTIFAALGTLWGALAALTLGASPLSAQHQFDDTPRLIDDVRYLASDRLGGRMTGSEGADSAAAYIARRFEQAGLQPAAGGWFQDFTLGREAAAAQGARVAGSKGRNVIGVFPGRNPALRNETVVLGAHYDHLGNGGFGSLETEHAGGVHNGADDNASGVAALIHVAARLRERPPARTVVFIAFSGEELGLLGSAYYVQRPPYPLAGTIAMVNLDMVGRLRNNRLIVYGVGTAREFPALVDSLNWHSGFDLKAQGDGYGPSDQSSFYAAKRPVLHLFTDLHEDYHRTTDDWEKIDVDGLMRVSDFTTNLVSALADRPKALAFVDLPAPTLHASGSSATAVTPGYGAYLGTIPDMAGTAGGVRLSGVRAGSPADKAGLRRDDVITRIGTQDVPDLQAMTDALRSHKPGDVVEITVKRGSELAKVQATLGSRGG